PSGNTVGIGCRKLIDTVGEGIGDGKFRIGGDELIYEVFISIVGFQQHKRTSATSPGFEVQSKTDILSPGMFLDKEKRPVETELFGIGKYYDDIVDRHST